MKNRQEGRKFDKGKPRPTLIPVRALRKCLKVLELGAERYGFTNWQKVEPERYVEACQRHLYSIIDSVQNEGNLFPKDKDTGYSEWAHVAVNALFMLWFEGDDDEDT